MSEVKISADEHAEIVEMHLSGKYTFYQIAKKVFKFENEETVEAVAQEVAKADEAGEFVAQEKAAKNTKK